MIGEVARRITNNPVLAHNTSEGWLAYQRGTIIWLAPFSVDELQGSHMANKRLATIMNRRVWRCDFKTHAT